MGLEHILGGIDHLLFLVALLALARGIWQTLTIVTGFTVAHSITLSLAVLGVVDVPSRIVDADMNEAPHDGATSGEIVVRAPWLTHGYFNNPDASEQ